MSKLSQHAALSGAAAEDHVVAALHYFLKQQVGHPRQNHSAEEGDLNSRNNSKLSTCPSIISNDL